MRRALAIGVVALLAGFRLIRWRCAATRATPSAPSSAGEAAAWNRGDLDGYLSGYEHAATTLFVGATQVYRGWDAIAAMYRKGHPDRARMGIVRFANLEVRPLGESYAVVVGRWSLERTKEAGGNAGGLFTLTLHKSAAGWRITVDHTS